MASRPAITSTEQRKPLQPTRVCETAKPERVRINGRACVEVDGGKWVELLRTAEYLTRGPKL